VFLLHLGDPRRKKGRESCENTYRAELPHARVGVTGGAAPAVDIGLAVDELDVSGALAVAVTRAVLGAGLVGGKLGQATVLVHLGEVDSTVQAAAVIWLDKRTKRTTCAPDGGRGKF